MSGPAFLLPKVTLTNYAEFKSVTENSLTQVNQQLNALEGSLETTVRDMVAGEVSGAAQNLAGTVVCQFGGYLV